MVIGLVSILILFLIKKFARKIPASLVIVILSIMVVYFFNLNNTGLAIIGEIPKGLPKFIVPEINQQNFTELSSLALTLALIGFMEAISIAKTIEVKHNNYKVKPNQELIALGFGNMIGSFFSGFSGYCRICENSCK